jgi:hypothetical protein
MSIKIALGTITAWNNLTPLEQGEYSGLFASMSNWCNSPSGGYDATVTDDMIFELISDVECSGVYDQDYTNFSGYSLTIQSRPNTSRYRYTVTDYDFGAAIYQWGGSNYEDSPLSFTARNIIFSNESDWGDDLIYLEGVKTITFEDCRFTEENMPYPEGWVVADSLWIINAAGGIDTVNITRCEFDKVSDDGIDYRNYDAESSGNIFISSCRFSNIADDGITMFNYLHGTIGAYEAYIEHCTFFNVYYYALNLSDDTNTNYYLDNIVVSCSPDFSGDSWGGSMYDASDLTGYATNCYDSQDIYDWGYSGCAFGSNLGVSFPWTDIGNNVDPTVEFKSIESGNANYLRLNGSTEGLSAGLWNLGSAPALSLTDLDGNLYSIGEGIYSIGCYQYEVTTIPIYTAPTQRITQPISIVLTNQRVSPYKSGVDNIQAKVAIYRRNRLINVPNLPIELWFNYLGGWRKWGDYTTNRFGTKIIHHECDFIPSIDNCLGFARVTWQGKTYDSNIVRFNFIYGVKSETFEYIIDASLEDADRSLFDIFDAMDRNNTYDRMY